MILALIRVFLRPFLAFLATIGFYTAVFAEVEPRELGREEVARILQRYDGFKSMDVDFKQTKIMKDIPTKLHSVGHLKIQRPNKLVWTVSKPSFVEVELIGTDVQITSGEAAERTVQKFKPGKSEKDPSARSLQAVATWFSLEPTGLLKDYKIEEVGKDTYRFTPHDPTIAPFQSIDLTMMASAGAAARIKEAIIHETSGDRLEIAFDDPQISKADSKDGAQK